MRIAIRSFALILTGALCSSWGFFGHETINRIAVFTLPPDMIRFYKRNIHYIVEASVNPDRRRYAIPEEGPRHYIDLDDYGDGTSQIPHRWSDAVAKLGEDSLMAHGIVPWHANRMYLQLRDAFMIGEPGRILRVSSELGHYIADAHVPLHTTSNHNGQKSNQHGIHGLWESRLPELFSTDYDFFTGKAQYVANVQEAMWKVVQDSHACVDSVLFIERELTSELGATKYSFETRGNQTIKVYSVRFSKAYHRQLDHMVERRMRASIAMVGNIWYTAWVDAGQPELKVDYEPGEEELLKRRKELEEWKLARQNGRVHDDH